VNHVEHQHQVALIQWAQRVRLPDAADVEPGASIACYLLAISNGGARPSRTRIDPTGKTVRYSPEGARLKAEGVKPGASDLLLPLRRDGFFALWLELKAPGKTPTKEQDAWIRRMRRAGYRAEWRDNWIAAANLIADYVGVRPPQ
jgi:hypothetical protein